MAGKMPVAFSLIGISLLLTLLTNFGSNTTMLALVLISTQPGSLDAVTAGEVWRLLTPAFVHFNIYHLVFNLLWVLILGGAIERIGGVLLIVAMFAVSAIASNLAEFYASGPFFGGMSGVVYAFVGYIWMQSRYNPQVYGRLFPPALIYFMLIWFAICWTGLIGGIANFAHTAGLIVGVVWGWLHSRKSARFI